MPKALPQSTQKDVGLILEDDIREHLVEQMLGDIAAVHGGIT